MQLALSSVAKPVLFKSAPAFQNLLALAPIFDSMIQKLDKRF